MCIRDRLFYYTYDCTIARKNTAIDLQDVYKRQALQWLAGELRIAPEEVMACGNAENDRDMLLYAG